MEDNENKSIVYQIHESDNVVTALTKVEIGVAQIHGENIKEFMQVFEGIDTGHKLVLRDIEKGEYIIKYGVIIGEATHPIKHGNWVHLHNCKSRFDERSSTLDVKTGVSTDILYESGSTI